MHPKKCFRYLDSMRSWLQPNDGLAKIIILKAIEIRADFFNLTNTPSFANPTNTFTNNAFGRIRGSVTVSERIIQLAMRFSF